TEDVGTRAGAAHGPRTRPAHAGRAGADRGARVRGPGGGQLRLRASEGGWVTAHPTDAATGSVATHCPYCALQCGMRLARSGDGWSLTGDPDFPVNAGALCVKGWTAAA